MERFIEVANGTRLCIDSFGDPRDPLALQLEGHIAQLIAIPDGFCTRLAGHGFHVVRVDHRDVGRSSRFPDSEYSVLDMVEDVHGLIGVLGGPAVVCGRSMGGMIAQLLACAYPDDVAGLGLFFTRAPASRPGVQRQDQSAPAASYPTFDSEDDFVSWELSTLPGLAGPAYPFPPGYLEDLARRSWRRGVDSGGFGRQAAAIAAGPGWRERIRSLTHPAVIVHGDHDPVIPVRLAYELHRLLPTARLQIVPGMGHQQPPQLDALFADIVTERAG